MSKPFGNPIRDRATQVAGIAGYRVFGKIHESDNTVVLRAERERDGLPVILKILQQARADDGGELRYRHEHAILSSLKLAGVIRCYGLEQLNGSWMLVLEDSGGESLKTLIESKRFALPETLALGARLADILGDMHAAHVIHKDINPANVVFNAETGALKIIDFALATVLSREQPSLGSPNMLEGTLPYISPEQTGRMNRAIDYRSDYYSFGATLYELLTGRRPFSSDDPLELVHCHIAKQPTPPCEVNPDIPAAVSDIVMKLLRKTAEERYQSAHGMKADLEECIRQLQQRGRIESFPLGAHDASGRFQIPQILYGRESEIQELLDLFDQASRGTREIVLVAGYSGIGKSSLVREIHKPVAERRGYFVSGKFEQFQRDVPYKAIVDVCRDLVRQLLSESEAHLAQWKEKLLHAFGADGQVIIGLVPDIELVIGAQPPAPALDNVQAQERFNRLFRDFIGLFCRPGRPLVVYLDDLQWADAGSLALIAHLLRDAGMHHLLVIGTYRDNEVNESHPLMLALAELRKHGVVPQQINLGPLGLGHVSELIAHTLQSSKDQVEPLAELVIAKTGGNPFFTEEFLKSLYTEQLLSFDRATGAWQWDLEQIRSRGITDNVVDLMTVKLQRQPKATQEVLQLAACIGAQFELNTLAIVLEQTATQTARALGAAIEDGLIAPVGGQYKYVGLDDSNNTLNVEYRFAHDRIQQAAYGLIPTHAKNAAHHKIGRLLLENTREEKLEENLFVIVNQLNAGVELIESERERVELTRFNLSAGKKAKASSAYQSALKYFKTGISVLGEESWDRHYEDLLVLHTEAAKAAYLGSVFGEMDRLIDIGLKRATTLLDKVPLHEIRIGCEIGRSRAQQAIDMALDVLRLLGVNLPSQPNLWHLISAFVRLKLRLPQKARAQLSSLPVMTDPRALAAMRILYRITSAAYWSRPKLSLLIAVTMIRLSMKYGNSPESASGYVSLAAFLCSTRRDYEGGYELAQIALRTIEQFDDKHMKLRGLSIFNFMVRHHKEHVLATLDPLIETYQASIELGEHEYAGSAILIYSAVSLTAGRPLAPLIEEMAKYSEALANLGQELILEILQIWQQTTINLASVRSAPCELIGEGYDGERKLSEFIAKDAGAALHIFYLAKMFLNYFFENYAQAVAYADLRREYIGLRSSTFIFGVGEFYDSLVRLATYAQTEPKERRGLLKQVGQNQKRLKLRARHAPMNHTHKVLLVEAERCRVTGDQLKAQDLYDKSIALAKEHGFAHECGLAHELAAKFHLGRGNAYMARPYMRDARRLYKQWGAAGKVADMDKKYASLLASPETDRVSTDASRISTDSSVVGMQSNIDLKALMLALKDISEEKIYSRLLEKTVRTAIASAGAQKGLLLLRKGKDELFIEAEGSVEKGEIDILRSIPLDAAVNLSQTVVNYVRRTKESVVVHDAQELHELLPRLYLDDYIKNNGVRSILCIPVKIGAGPHAELVGLLYLENNGATHAFTDQRVETLEIICLSAAGRIELSREAVTDSLTGLYNHNYFQNVLRKELSAARRKRRQLSLIMADIDHFKSFNDTWGHQVGDLVLQSVSNWLKLSCRQTDVVARYGGEEMAIILPETDAAMALEVAERIRLYIEKATVNHDGHALKVTTSLGISTLVPEMEDAAALIKAADDALYRSKADGRNRSTPSA